MCVCVRLFRRYLGSFWTYFGRFLSEKLFKNKKQKQNKTLKSILNSFKNFGIAVLTKNVRETAEIINKISLPAFLSKQVLSQARNFTSLEIQNIYSELAVLDLRIKFQSSLAPLIIQDLFQRICSGNSLG